MIIHVSQRYPSRLESRAGFFASTRDECLSPRVRLECTFGDGTKLTVYPVTVKTAYREEREGIMFAYTGKDGYTYIYDSDKISYDDLKP